MYIVVNLNYNKSFIFNIPCHQSDFAEAFEARLDT